MSGRRMGRAILAVSARAMPAQERTLMEEEVGGLIDAAASEGRHGEALLHGISSLRTISPAAFAADLAQGNRHRHRFTWMWWVGLAVVLIGADAILPSTDSRSLYRLTTVAACAIVGYAALAAPKGNKLGWGLVAAGVTAFVTGDLVFAAIEPSAFPSVVDVMYLSMYPLLSLGALCVVRGYSSITLWPSLIAAAVAGGVAFVGWWRYFDLSAGMFPLEATVVATAYPALDAALLVLLTSFALRVRPMRRPLALLVAGVASLNVADFGYNVALSNGTFTTAMWMNSFWLGFFAIITAAALHPTDNEVVATHDRSSNGQAPRATTAGNTAR